MTELLSLGASPASIQVLSEYTPPWLDEALQVRRIVFVEEQGVASELELDGEDGRALQFLARLGGRSVGTGRLRRVPEGWKLERVAVLPEVRKIGVGRRLAQAMLAAIPPGERALMNAQVQALPFWTQWGFEPEGPRFMEAGIEHQRLIRVASAPDAE